jgi:hypothetical protein
VEQRAAGSRFLIVGIAARFDSQSTVDSVHSMGSEALQRPLERRSLELFLKFVRRDRPSLRNLASKQCGISNTQMML